MTRPTMTMTELRREYPALFYRQDWFLRERFMGIYPNTSEPSLPRVKARGVIPEHGRDLPRAVDLAHAYVRHPDADCWRQFWWTADTDAKGQRIYVGGVSAENGRRFEIHRHLTINDHWCTPL